MRCYLFDIDGTVALGPHRLPHLDKTPKDWNAYYENVIDDIPVPHICELVKTLGRDTEILFVSGRSDHVRDMTCLWLHRHAFTKGALPLERRLYMRQQGDHRPDYIIKSEILDCILGLGYQPIMAFDDRDQTVAAWRQRGIPCAQVAPGNF